MFSEELMNFIKNQEDDEMIVNVASNVYNLIESLKELKKSFSVILSQLFVENDIDGIQEIIEYGNEIDEFINELHVLDFGKTISRTENADIKEPEEKTNNTERSSVRYSEKAKETERSGLRYSEKAKETERSGLRYSERAKETERSNVKLSRKEGAGKILNGKVKQQNNIALEKHEKSCILCGKPVWKESDYCKEHIVYDDSNKIQSGGMTE